MLCRNTTARPAITVASKSGIRPTVPKIRVKSGGSGCDPSTLSTRTFNGQGVSNSASPEATMSIAAATASQT